MHAAARPAHGVAQHPDLFPVLAAEEHEYLLGPAVKPDEGKQVRLVEDPAAYGEDRFHVSSDQRVAVVAKPPGESGVHREHSAVVAE